MKSEEIIECLEDVKAEVSTDYYEALNEAIGIITAFEEAIECGEAAVTRCPGAIGGEPPFEECRGCLKENYEADQDYYDEKKVIECWRKLLLDGVGK